jgi:hypothetical protein
MRAPRRDSLHRLPLDCQRRDGDHLLGHGAGRFNLLLSADRRKHKRRIRCYESGERDDRPVLLSRDLPCDESVERRVDASYSILNKGNAPISSWTLTFEGPGNQEVTQPWNANYSQSGANVTFTNESYNGTIVVGATLSGMGFNGSYSGTNKAPSAFYVNGTQCH